MEQNPTIAAWRAAGESGDAAAAGRCLGREVELFSPLTAAFRFRGPAQVTEVLTAAFEVIHDIRFHTELGAGACCAGRARPAWPARSSWQPVR